MFDINAPPKEGDIYKIIKVGTHTFELRYGYYEEFERDNGEPVVIYPELTRKLYTEDGYLIVTAVQEPCNYYEVHEHKARDECCVDCAYYSPPGEDIGICKCKQNLSKLNEGDTRI